jgi:hypothetical protein
MPIAVVPFQAQQKPDSQDQLARKIAMPFVRLMRCEYPGKCSALVGGTSCSLPITVSQKADYLESDHEKKY